MTDWTLQNDPNSTWTELAGSSTLTPAVPEEDGAPDTWLTITPEGSSMTPEERRATETAVDAANRAQEYRDTVMANVGVTAGLLSDVQILIVQQNAIAAGLTAQYELLDESVAATAADRTQTGLDRVATGSDRIQTGSDRTQTGLDRVATGQDKAATAADRTQVGVDRTGAETARTAAETAQTGAQTARTAAETAQTGAQAARTGAETARDAALGYRDTASGYATTATTQAGNAATSATNANNSKIAAGTSETNAHTSEVNAATSATNASSAAVTEVANRAVRYDTAQTLTNAQKIQAIANINGRYDAIANMNLAVNGFMNVSQEKGATAVTLTTSAQHITDEWEGFFAGTMGATGQQVANPFPTAPGIPFGLKINVTTAQAVLGANDFLGIRQLVEGLRVARLNWGAASGNLPLSLGVYIRPSINCTVTVSARNAGAFNRSFLRKVALLANTDNFVDLSGALAIPADTTGTWAKDTTAGLAITFCFGVGTTFQGAADAWLATNSFGTSDTTNLAATVNNNVIVSGLVMLPGLVLPPKEVWPLLARHYDDELRLCQRYWQIVAASIAPITVPSGATMAWPVSIPVPMRLQPSVSISGVAGGGTTTVGPQNEKMLMFRLASTYGASDSNCTATASCNARM